MDKKGAKVENYKITPEQRDFQKKFKQLASMRDMLTQRSLMLAYQKMSTDQMLRQIAVGMQKLTIPKEGTRELPGMNFAVEEDQIPQGSPDNSDLFNI